MKTTFTFDELRASKGCYSNFKINFLLFIFWITHLRRIVTLEEILDSNIDIGDKKYFVLNYTNISNDVFRSIYNSTNYNDYAFILTVKLYSRTSKVLLSHFINY